MDRRTQHVKHRNGTLELSFLERVVHNLAKMSAHLWYIILDCHGCRRSLSTRTKGTTRKTRLNEARDSITTARAAAKISVRSCATHLPSTTRMSETKPTNQAEIPAVESPNDEAPSSRDSTPPIPEEPTRAGGPSSSPPRQVTINTTAPTSTTVETETTSPTSIRTQRETPVHPQVVALRSMFPDYDDTILCVS